ncbi:unnamed protein product, partial [Eretmochelys imbricata]
AVGRGVAADAEVTTQMLSSNMSCTRWPPAARPGWPPPAASSSRCCSGYQGHIGASLILGGVDSTGPTCTASTPTAPPANCPSPPWALGLRRPLRFLRIGSSQTWSWRRPRSSWPTPSRPGCWGDLGSGSNVDLCVLTRGGGPDPAPLPHPHRPRAEAGPVPVPGRHLGGAERSRRPPAAPAAGRDGDRDGRRL